MKTRLGIRNIILIVLAGVLFASGVSFVMHEINQPQRYGKVLYLHSGN